MLVVPFMPSFLLACVAVFGLVVLYAVVFKLRHQSSDYTFLGDKPSGSWH